MVLVGPSLGAAVAIDFAVNYPEAVPACYDLIVFSPFLTSRLAHMKSPTKY
jgi:alpha-beta hydrolase superfamily lysophospholipase